MSKQPRSLGVERFRILVVGNANAGKTTILKTVCHAEGRNPVYLDDKGKKIVSELKPSVERGEHDIGHQFQYPSAHGFVFHDSRGFEAGGSEELKKVNDFIETRSNSEHLKDQLHVIWYCLTTSNDRGMTDAEMSLFESGTGNVPVIAVFTKMDVLIDEARNQLIGEEVPFEELQVQVPFRARAIFEKNYLRRLDNVKHPPHDVVQLYDMDKEGANCDDLILKTSQALGSETLELFCLSILRNDVESRIRDVINLVIIPKAKEALKSGTLSDKKAESLFCDVMYCFPHMLPTFDNLIHNMGENAIDASKPFLIQDRQQLLQNLLLQLEERLVNF